MYIRSYTFPGKIQSTLYEKHKSNKTACGKTPFHECIILITIGTQKTISQGKVPRDGCVTFPEIPGKNMLRTNSKITIYFFFCRTHM